MSDNNNDLTHLDSYRKTLLEHANKSQDRFETQLTYLSGGGLVGSMFIVEKLFPKMEGTTWKSTLLISCIAFTTCLVVNLFSLICTYKSNHQTLADIDQNGDGFDRRASEKRAKHITFYNTASVCSLMAAIIMFILFITINFFSMAKETKPAPRPDETRGYVPPSAPPPRQPPASPSQPITQPSPRPSR